ncbi:MAG: 2'-deoxycytidine 5'-triphosphate deaminase [Actinobacteria bacterium]|nr:2'-deoxycytidine 5'-triphosphate deaminase [Actinomycetota bacterium]
MTGGILPAQRIRQAIEDGWVAADPAVPAENVQPASLDLRLGVKAYALRCSFLPDDTVSIETKLGDLAITEFDIRAGAVLERNRPYLIPLTERVALPGDVRGRTNPKSSTGRIDVFTRVISEGNFRFDEIPAGYEGPLYLEVVSRSFAIRVQQGLTLNQLRLVSGDARCTDAEIVALHEDSPLVHAGDAPLDAAELRLADGLFLSVDLEQGEEPAGYKARPNAPLLDLARVGEHDAEAFWEPIYAGGGRTILQPEEFYLLISRERVQIPPWLGAEMTAYDPTAGELRTHYAGFFDPGFGFDPEGRRHGARAVLEVRARDVPFMVEHAQRICKLGFEQMIEPPDLVYGERIGSSYQYQELTLSKHFRAHRARQLALTGLG